MEIYGAFIMGFLIAAIIGMLFTFNCYSKRELTERKMRQNFHNLEVLRKEDELKIEQLKVELKRAREENRKFIGNIDFLHQELEQTRSELEECKQRVADALAMNIDKIKE